MNLSRFLFEWSKNATKRGGPMNGYGGDHTQPGLLRQSKTHTVLPREGILNAVKVFVFFHAFPGSCSFVIVF